MHVLYVGRMRIYGRFLIRAECGMQACENIVCVFAEVVGSLQEL